MMSSQWEREGDSLNTKYFYVVHSELKCDSELSWRKPGGIEAVCNIVSVQ